MESRNPVLRNYDERYAAAQAAPAAVDPAMYTPEQLQEMFARPSFVGGRVTLDDVVVKTGISFVVLLVGAVIGWQLVDDLPLLVWGGALVAFGLAMVNIFKKQVSPALILAYAAFEGVFLGGISKWYEVNFSNGDGSLVLQAVTGTLVAFGVMLTLYKTGVIKVDNRFRKVMTVAMVSYLVIALGSLVSSFFGVGGGWGFYGVGGLGLLLCAGAVLLASLSLALDFEAIQQSIQQGLPERESWRLAFGLIVTLVWLYLEILRFLAILNSGD